MKKLLMPLMATAICALLTTGCVKGPDDIPPSPTPTPTPTPTPEEQYDAAFKTYVGGTIASNQDWGFNAGVVAARGMTRGSEKGYFIDDDYDKEYSQSYYDAIFARLPEREKVAEGIQKNFEFQDNGPFRFDIIFSCTLVKGIEIGYYHYGKDETPDKRKEVMLVQSLDKDLPTKAYYQYIKSFGDWITPDAAMGYNMFKVDNAQRVHAKMITLRAGSGGDPEDVPVNDRVGFYVKINGKTYYTNRYLNDNEEDKYFAVTYDEKDGEKLYNSWVVGIEDLYDNDYDCNDIIIAVNKNLEPNYPTLITPEKPVNPTWRVIGEDLSAEDKSDFDFNDIVLDVTLTKDGADCVLQAAGGQLPLRVNGQDDYEVHKLFKVDQKMMVNTINLEKNPELKKYDPGKKDPVKFSIKGSFSSVKQVPIEVKKDDGQWHPLYADTGKTACKILVDPTFKWADECHSIGDPDYYPKFFDWVKDRNVKWYP